MPVFRANYSQLGMAQYWSLINSAYEILVSVVLTDQIYYTLLIDIYTCFCHETRDDQLLIGYPFDDNRKKAEPQLLLAMSKAEPLHPYKYFSSTH